MSVDIYWPNGYVQQLGLALLGARTRIDVPHFQSFCSTCGIDVFGNPGAVVTSAAWDQAQDVARIQITCDCGALFEFGKVIDPVWPTYLPRRGKRRV